MTDGVSQHDTHIMKKETTEKTEKEESRCAESLNLFTSSEPFQRNFKPFDFERAFTALWELRATSRGSGKHDVSRIFARALVSIALPDYKKRKLSVETALRKANHEHLRSAATVIIRGYKLAVQQWRADKTEEKYIPHITTWLNQARWETVSDETRKVDDEEPEEFAGAESVVDIARRQKRVIA